MSDHDLSALTFDQLKQFSQLVDTLVSAGDHLLANGYSPIFQLIPGFSVGITLDHRMPTVPAAASLLACPPPAPETEPAGLAEPGGATPEAGNPPPAPVVAKAPAPVPPPIPAAAGGAGPTGAEPAAKGAPWTEDENARAVQLVAQWIDTGMTKGAAIAAAAAELGRPASGLEFRLKTALRDALAAELDREPSEPAPPADPAPGPADEPAPPAEPGPPADPAPDIDPELDPLAAHLAARPMKGWSLADDADLMHLAELGWTPPEIAIELNRPGDAIKARFEVLTGNRRFARAQVAERLAQLRAQYDAGAAA